MSISARKKALCVAILERHVHIMREQEPVPLPPPEEPWNPYYRSVRRHQGALAEAAVEYEMNHCGSPDDVENDDEDRDLLARARDFQRSVRCDLAGAFE